MAGKTVSYISIELEWLESKVKQLQNAVDSYDLLNLSDRRGPKELPNGKVVNGVIATQEQQLKAVTDIMEKIQKMLPAIDQMREKEESKIETRGKSVISAQAEDWLKERKPA